MRNTATTFLGTAGASVGSWLASDYDKIASALLALGGFAFLVWRWRKAAKSHLCDKAACPLRHNPAED
jgi:hypothetical protein